MIRRELQLSGGKLIGEGIGEGIAVAGIAVAVAIVLGSLAVRGGLQAYACGSNPYLTFCTGWVDDERAR